MDKRVRITAQLIDATTGYHLWAEHYDGELNDIFALQDSVTQKIVNALSPKLSSEGSSTLAHRQTTNVDAHDLFLRGLAIKLKPQKETNPEARRLFQAAIELDPNYALAYSWLAITYADEWTYLWTQDSGALARGIDIARKAVALDGSLAEARRALGYILVLDKQYEPGLPELEKAVSLDPNSSVAYGTLANALNLLGRPEEAIGFVKKAMRVDPKYGPWVACWLGDSYYWLHRYGEAVAAYQDAVRRNPNYLTARRNLAATYAEMGRERDAKAEAAEVLRLNPSFSVELFRSRIAIKSEADLNRLVTALQKAGLK